MLTRITEAAMQRVIAKDLASTGLVSKMGLKSQVKHAKNYTAKITKRTNQVMKLRWRPWNPCSLAALTSRQLIRLKNWRKMKVLKIRVKCFILSWPAGVSSIAWVALVYWYLRIVLPANIIIIIMAIMYRPTPKIWRYI